MPRRDHDDATLRFGDDDEMDDLGYGRTYSDEDEDEEGWTAPKEGSDLWDEPEDAALDDEEEGLAERDIGDDDEGGDDDVADLFADEAPRRGRKRGAPMVPPAPTPSAPAVASSAASAAPAKRAAAPKKQAAPPRPPAKKVAAAKKPAAKGSGTKKKAAKPVKKAAKKKAAPAKKAAKKKPAKKSASSKARKHK
jgi:hypothetical protein